MDKQILRTDWTYLLQWVQHCEYLCCWLLAAVRQLCLLAKLAYYPDPYGCIHKVTNAQSINRPIINYFQPHRATQKRVTPRATTLNAQSDASH